MIRLICQIVIVTGVVARMFFYVKHDCVGRPAKLPLQGPKLFESVAANILATAVQLAIFYGAGLFD